MQPGFALTSAFAKASEGRQRATRIPASFRPSPIKGEGIAAGGDTRRAIFFGDWRGAVRSAGQAPRRTKRSRLERRRGSCPPRRVNFRERKPATAGKHGTRHTGARGGCYPPPMRISGAPMGSSSMPKNFSSSPGSSSTLTRTSQRCIRRVRVKLLWALSFRSKS